MSLLYGLDKELGISIYQCINLIFKAEKQAAKYNPEREAQVREWIENVSGEKVIGDFQECLKDGIILCKYVKGCII